MKKRPQRAKAARTRVAKHAQRAKTAEPQKRVEVSAAKGRPMLVWVGKRPLRQVTAFPAQHVESFNPVKADVSLNAVLSDPDLSGESKDAVEGWPKPYPHAGLLFHGDNKEVLAHLLAGGFRGKVKLIYIDPPFDSGADYVRSVQLRGAKGAAKVDGEGYTLGEQIQYTDIWANDNYLQFMYERLLLIKELLSPTGSIYLHADSHRCHSLRMLMDEVFGEAWFRSQISWKRTSSHGGASRYGAVTDFLLFYASDMASWNPQFQQITQEHKERHYRFTDERGLFALGELTGPGITNGPSGQPWKGFDVRALGRHWAYVPEELDRLDTQNLIYWPEKSSAWPRLKRYWDEHKGRPCTDFWDDIDPINMVALEREDYPTQKPESLVERIVLSSSDSGDLILDSFIGSGTTAAVAQKLGRRWIGCDINKGAVQTTSKRLQGIIREQMEQIRKETQGELGLGSAGAEEKKVERAQLSFAVYRVNDYDLQIQHNEAVNLACEHIGVSRTRSDAFFDGTLGKRLVKVIPFNHPLSPLDLEEVKKELSARPGEDRDIVVVCLGKELASDAWVEEWNRLRKKGDVPNKIEVIELRTDPKYGKFIKHEPARAKVKISRKNATIHVVIEDFISPTIIERLSQQSGIVHPKIDDWRSMVDCVMIDTDYQGEVFNVCLSDVPEKKSDLVSGSYEFPAPKRKTKVAVKIVDMLGEEVVEVREV